MESPCDWHLEPARCFRMKSTAPLLWVWSPPSQAHLGSSCSAPRFELLAAPDATGSRAPGLPLGSLAERGLASILLAALILPCP